MHDPLQAYKLAMLAPLVTAAARAVVTPTSEKAPDAANVGGPVQTETKSLIFEQHADDGKRARLALADLRAVAAFVRQVGGAA